ncbi:NYN domain-containing protein [Salinisphaera sp.]|uniref:NYN domain-containing protein n=1 Tax=Salinisphaera sp. TaxID=1914330 RepID=UPI0025F50996|nr:NYN domain-containing protein [Salinisphaera sp.]
MRFLNYNKNVMRRTAVYVDGFNLYYGALRNTPYRWFDIDRACSTILHGDNQIVQIKYFTALVDGSIDPDGQQRQKLYIKALKAWSSHLEVHYGHFLAHAKHMKNANPPPAFCNVINIEEKGSDVNLAAHFIRDAFLDEYDVGVVVSNDSDLVEAVRIVKEDAQKVTGVILPLRKGRRASKKLSKAPHFVRELRSTTVAASQLPEQIPDTKLFKPERWAK